MNMMMIDTGDSGTSQGPWVAWSSNGSAEKGFAPRTWVLRDKDELGNKVEAVVSAFEKGCVIDLDSLKLGWEKDGGKGMAPERRWNPTLSQATPRPDDSKKPTGAFAWSRALTVRCSIGGGKAATWEQGSFAAYEAFSRLAKQIMAQFPGDNTLPFVRQTGVEKKTLPNGTANIPILEIVKWVPRPDCLKADAPQIAVDDYSSPRRRRSEDVDADDEPRRRGRDDEPVRERRSRRDEPEDEPVRPRRRRSDDDV